MTDENSAVVAFGERLYTVRMQRQLSQMALARRVGVGQATISRIERGEYRQVTATVVDCLATALECHPNHLLFGTGFTPAERLPYERRTRPIW